MSWDRPLPSNSQKSELKRVFDNAPPDPSAVMVSAAARKAMLVATGEEKPEPETKGAPVDEKEGKRLDVIGDDCPMWVFSSYVTDPPAVSRK